MKLRVRLQTSGSSRWARGTGIDSGGQQAGNRTAQFSHIRVISANANIPPLCCLVLRSRNTSANGLLGTYARRVRSGRYVYRRILHSTPAFDPRGLRREIGIGATVSGPHDLTGIRPCHFLEADFWPAWLRVIQLPDWSSSISLGHWRRAQSSACKIFGNSSFVGAATKVLEDPGFHGVTMLSDNVYGHFRRRTLTIEAIRREGHRWHNISVFSPRPVIWPAVPEIRRTPGPSIENKRNIKEY